jgi:uncharacterized membrane protein YhaH (DUF805 family)
MWNVYFGEWHSGRLKRLPYLGYDLLIWMLSFVIIFGLIMLAGGFENVVSPDALAGVGILGMIFFFLFFIGALVANLNIMAKRIRDMGLPAWKSVLGIILVSIVLELLFPAQQMEISAVATQTPEGFNSAVDANASTGSVVTQVFNLIIFLCLIFIPSDAFKKNVV